MTATPREPTPKRGSPADDHAPWIDWRAQQLRAAGCAPALARELAGDRRVDLHTVLELLDRGCPPDLAARIAAPLEGRMP